MFICLEDDCGHAKTSSLLFLLCIESRKIFSGSFSVLFFISFWLVVFLPCFQLPDNLSGYALQLITSLLADLSLFLVVPLKCQHLPCHYTLISVLQAIFPNVI